MTAPTIIPITKTEDIRAAGVDYPTTVDGWRWLYRKRSERGLEQVFKRVGRRVLLDVPAYLEAVRKSSAA